MRQLAEARGDDGLGGAVHEALAGQPVRDELGDGDEAQPVLAGEDLELRPARHGAVVVEDLADDAGGLQAGQAGEVHRGLGLADAAEDAAGAGPQGEDVARAAEVGGPWCAGRGSTWMVVARSAALMPVVTPKLAVGVDGDGEGRALRFGVVVGHRAQVQLVGALGGEREADEPAAVGGHEVDGLGGDVRGRADQVAFVLAVLVVGHDDHPPLADVLDGVLDTVERHGPPSWRRSSLASGGILIPPGAAKVLGRGRLVARGRAEEPADVLADQVRPPR